MYWYIFSRFGNPASSLGTLACLIALRYESCFRIFGEDVNFEIRNAVDGGISDTGDISPTAIR
jgi:hypothetical protein